MKYKTRVFEAFGSSRILFIFDDEFDVLTTFFTTDVRQFHSYMIEFLENVLSGKCEDDSCSFNVTYLEIHKDKCLVLDLMSEEDGEFASCEIPTQELLDLVKKWVRQNRELQESIKKMRRKRGKNEI